ncbi:hypothetical protein C0J52_01801 [Blattella germanica]|nr:hypothetical protein C0J52_01801 [Blattella germanica]
MTGMQRFVSQCKLLMDFYNKYCRKMRVLKDAFGLMVYRPVGVMEWLKIMELVGGPSSPAVNQGHVFYTGGCQPFLATVTNSGGDDK